MMIGSTCAANSQGFNINDSFKNVYDSEYYSVYATADQSSRINIYKNVNDDVYDDITNDDVFDGVIHHDGSEYTVPDDDMKIDKNSDNTANFTDMDHATKGVCEIVKHNGEEYIVVCWAKDNSNLDFAKLISRLNGFNKDNNVNAIAF